MSDTFTLLAAIVAASPLVAAVAFAIWPSDARLALMAAALAMLGLAWLTVAWLVGAVGRPRISSTCDAGL